MIGTIYVRFVSRAYNGVGSSILWDFMGSKWMDLTRESPFEEASFAREST